MKEIALMWDIPKRNAKIRTKLHKDLYGSMSTKNGRTYYYDGLLTVWKDGKREINIHHLKLGESCISIPDMHKKHVTKVLQVFERLKVPVRQLKLIDNHFFKWS